MAPARIEGVTPPGLVARGVGGGLPLHRGVVGDIAGDAGEHVEHRHRIGANHQRFAEHLVDMFPVHEMVDERLQIVRTAVAVVDVVGVLPHIAAEQRAGAVVRLLAHTSPLDSK